MKNKIKKSVKNFENVSIKKSQQQQLKGGNGGIQSQDLMGG